MINPVNELPIFKPWIKEQPIKVPLYYVIESQFRHALNDMLVGMIVKSKAEVLLLAQRILEALLRPHPSLGIPPLHVVEQPGGHWYVTTNWNPVDTYYLNNYYCDAYLSPESVEKLEKQPLIKNTQLKDLRERVDNFELK